MGPFAVDLGAPIWLLEILIPAWFLAMAAALIYLVWWSRPRYWRGVAWFAAAIVIGSIPHFAAAGERLAGAAVRLAIPLTRPAPGHFAGKFELVPLFSQGKPVLRNGHQYYALRNPLAFTTAAGDTVTMFAGSRTDLASTPQAVWWPMPPDGPWAEATIPHDNCYRTSGTFTWYGHLGRTRAAPYTRAECDEILRQAMVALGVPGWKRVAIYEAVRLGGSGGWGS